MIHHIVAVPLLIVVSGFGCLEFFMPIAIGEFMAGILGARFRKKKERVIIHSTHGKEAS